MQRLKVLLSALAVALVAGCGMTPVKQSEGHLRAEPTRSEGEIPPPVQLVAPLPRPRPTARPETYSVVVNNVRVDDLLFALARDAKVNVDIHPGVTGTVTLNAIDQTLPQLLNRIARQVDMRYELDGQTLMVMRDTPFLRAYKIDYVSASRNVRMQSTYSTEFSSTTSASGASAGGAAGAATGSTARIDVTSTNQVWEAIVQNVKDILQETDKVFPAAARSGAPAAGAAPVQAGAAQAAPAGQSPAAAQAAAAAQPSAGFREAASVIGNRESGVLFVRASSQQHEKVQQFLDNVLASTRREVLVEATIVEVQLNNQYQRGIDWSRVRRGASGVSLFGNSAGTPAGIDTGAFIINAAAASVGFQATIRLLESFGDVKVLSSPKISVLNNQTALLRVTTDIIYFTITPSTTPITVAGGSGNLSVQQSFTTTPNVAAEGFMMSVLPQINDADTIVMNVRPTIRRRIGFQNDPNPALSDAKPNRIPIFETRELDSILRIQSGQTAVLGGLMQDQVTNTEDGIPGVSRVPGLGALFEQRRDTIQKTELVIFLRATVVRDPSIAGDYREFRNLLPGGDFLTRPNPGKPEPFGEPARQ